MADKINVGLRVPSVQPCDPKALRQFIVEAENMGFHSIWVGDHVFYHMDVPDPIGFLTWTAALTSHVRLGTAIMLTAYRDPVLLAKSAATLDRLSGGRVTLGVSIGGTEAEYRSLGVDMKKRVTHLRRNIAVMRELWTKDEVDYEDEFRTIVRGRVTPKPVQRPIPLWLGGGSESMQRRVAEIGDGWIGGGGGSAETFHKGVETVKDEAAKRGRDLRTIGFGKLACFSVDQDHNRARDLAVRQWHTYYGPHYDVDRNVIYGTPEECLGKLRQLGAADVPELTFVLEPPSLDRKQLELTAQVASDFGGPGFPPGHQ